MLWHEHSWPKLRARDKSIPVIVPLGSCEQHGHHLPVFVDTLQVTAVAEKVEKMMPDQLLLVPTMWLGTSHHHLDFPGTISIPPTLYSENIKWITRCILRAGFKRIFFLNGHGGNEVPATHALTELIAENDEADAAHLAFASWWRVGKDAIAPEKHGLETPFVSHACEYETSFILALRPDLVDLKEARDEPPPLDNGWVHSFYPHLSKVSLFHRFHRLSGGGSMGKPTRATAEKGRSIFEAVANDVAAFIKAFAGWPDRISLGPK